MEWKNCGGFSPFLWKNRGRGAERGSRSGKGRSGAHSPLSAAKKPRIALSCILRSKIGHFCRFHTHRCVCGDARRFPFLLRILRTNEGAAGILQAFLPFRLALPVNAVSGRDAPSFFCFPTVIAPLCFPLLKLRPHTCIMSL